VAFTTRVNWKLVSCKVLSTFIPVNILNSDISYFVLFVVGGSNAKEKCPLAISDIVMMFNQVQKGLHRPL
jgi:hypothetical protein